MQNWGRNSFIQHLLLKFDRDDRWCATTFVLCPSLYYPLIACILARARIRTHFNRSFIFCCHKCHTTSSQAAHLLANNTSFSTKQHVTFPSKWSKSHSQKQQTLKLYVKPTKTHSQSEHYRKACDTCDSKISKTLCRARARVRARTKGKYFLASFFGLRCRNIRSLLLAHHWHNFCVAFTRHYTKLFSEASVIFILFYRNSFAFHQRKRWKTINLHKLIIKNGKSTWLNQGLFLNLPSESIFIVNGQPIVRAGTKTSLIHPTTTLVFSLQTLAITFSLTLDF